MARARGINKVILVGKLGNDPETSYTHSNMPVCKISLATTSVRNDRDGNRQEQTQWHRVTFFGKLAEIAGEYLRKGRQVYIEGELRYGKYTGQDGIERYTTDIIANEMQMLDSGGSGEGGGFGGGGSRGDESGYGGGYERGPRQAPAQRREPQRQAPPPAPADFGGSDGFDDDDIPF